VKYDPAKFKKKQDARLNGVSYSDAPATLTDVLNQMMDNHRKFHKTFAIISKRDMGRIKSAARASGYKWSYKVDGHSVRITIKQV